MKERPILFSGEMVRAIVEKRKRQTRRICKFRITGPNPPKGSLFDMYDGDRWIGAFPADRGLAGKKNSATANCPYGVPGDRLWVREALQTGARNNPEPRYNHAWRYAADNQLVMIGKETQTEMLVWATHKDGDFCPSIHMPRWASRLTLEIVKVRVERVQDISEEDAVAEGVAAFEMTEKDLADLEISDERPEVKDFWKRMGPGLTTHVMEYRMLWDSINAKREGGIYAWAKNPWVWAVEFNDISGDCR